MLSCRECGATFSVHPNDQNILDYFDAPPPTLCAPHSLRQRLAFRNERHLYKRTCDLCKKDILAMFSPRSYAKTYCRECWYSDNWDPLQYGRPHDPSRSFIDQLIDLIREVPFFNLFQIGESVNSDYCNITFNSKDSYLSFSNIRSEGSLYCKNVDDGLDCTDCFCVTKSELLYDCVSVRDSYKSAYLTRSEKCSGCYLGRDLTDCQNCFGCVNLKYKQWYWYNEPLTEDEYIKRLSDALMSRSSFDEHIKKFKVFEKSLPVENATIRASEDSTGNYIYNSRNIRNSFFITDGENNGDCFRAIWNSKDNYRTSYGGTFEKSYNSMTLPFTTSAIGCLGCEHSSFVSYCWYCQNTDSSFGCIGLRKKKFCILNTQYSETEYTILSEKIIGDMKERGEWGAFLAMEYSPWAYNESVGCEYFPLSKDECEGMGLRWEDEQFGSRGKETIIVDSIPESINSVQDSITKEIIACASCGMNYKILKKELERLRNFHLPVPHLCQDCRFTTRFERHFVPILYSRECMCVKLGHGHDAEGMPGRAGSTCVRKFETTYRPEGKDIVYCKPCYQECLQ